MRGGQRQLGALLVEQGLLEPEQLTWALEEQRRSGHRLGRILVQLGLLGEDRVLDALAEQLGLERWEPEGLPSFAAARATVPRSVAFAARCLPLVRAEEGGQDVVVIATSDPLSPLVAHVSRSVDEHGAVVRWLLGGEDDVERGLLHAYGQERAGSVIMGRPDSSPRAASLHRPSPAEQAGIDALDARLGALSGHAVLSDEPPAVSALRVGASLSTGHTLLADDAVLEVVEVGFDRRDLAYVAPSLNPEPESEWERESVALARLAIRRAEAPSEGLKEVVRPGWTAEARDAGGPRLGILAKAPALDPLLPLNGPVHKSAAPGSSSASDRRALGPAPNERPAPNLSLTHVELIETVRPIGDERHGRGGAADRTPVGGDFAGAGTEDVFGSEPTAGHPELVDEEDVLPLEGPEVLFVPREASEAPTGPLEPGLVLSSEAESPASAWSPAADDLLDPPTASTPASLHAALERFAAGAPLDPAHRDDAFRVVVAALLDAGWLDPAAVGRLLGSGGQRATRVELG